MKTVCLTHLDLWSGFFFFLFVEIGIFLVYESVMVSIIIVLCVWMCECAGVGLCLCSLRGHSVLQREREQSTGTGAVWWTHLQRGGEFNQSVDRWDVCYVLYHSLTPDFQQSLTKKWSCRFCAGEPVQQCVWLSGGGAVWALHLLQGLRLRRGAGLWIRWAALPEPVSDGGVCLSKRDTHQASSIVPVSKK